MTKKEVAQICSTIRKTTFAWKNETDDVFEQIVYMWFDCLRDEPYDMAQKALQVYLQNNTYPPTVADIYRPYKEWLENQNELRFEYNTIYFSAIAHYPGYEDTEEVRKEFDRITGKSISKATRLSDKLIAFVKDQELSEEYIPPIIDWLKGVESID